MVIMLQNLLGKFYSFRQVNVRASRCNRLPAGRTALFCLVLFKTLALFKILYHFPEILILFPLFGNG